MTSDRRLKEKGLKKAGSGMGNGGGFQNLKNRGAAYGRTETEEGGEGALL
ncbi:MAG: hypothetical protein V1835_05200 [Candidatus Micrarchaeota archaeon]